MTQFKEGDKLQLPWGVAEFERDLGGEYLVRSGDVGYCVDPADVMGRISDNDDPGAKDATRD